MEEKQNLSLIALSIRIQVRRAARISILASSTQLAAERRHFINGSIALTSTYRHDLNVWSDTTATVAHLPPVFQRAGFSVS